MSGVRPTAQMARSIADCASKNWKCPASRTTTCVIRKRSSRDGKRATGYELVKRWPGWRAGEHTHSNPTSDSVYPESICLDPVKGQYRILLSCMQRRGCARALRLMA